MYIQTYEQTNKHIIHINANKHTMTDKQTNTDKQIYRITDKQPYTDRQIYKIIDRQIEKFTD